MKDPVYSPSFAPLTAALLYLVVFLCSAVAAFLFYGLLQSAGILKVKGVELAGAVVGFVVIFYLSHRMVRDIMDRLSSTDVAAQLSEKDSKIRELTRVVASLRAGELPPVTCPEGFSVNVSRDSGIAYAFPATWEQATERIVGRHMRPSLLRSSMPDFKAALQSRSHLSHPVSSKISRRQLPKQRTAARSCSSNLFLTPST